MSRCCATRAPPRIRCRGSEAERLRFWSGRKNAFPAAGRISPDYYCMDGTIPRKNLGQMLVAIAEMERKYGLRCMNVFHAGDGNLHPLILFDANDPDEWQRAEHFGAEILEQCVEVGGTITGEHGVGIEKINPMCVQFSPARAARLSSRSSAPSIRRACSTPARRSRRLRAAPSTARCTCTAAQLPFSPNCRGSEPADDVHSTTMRRAGPRRRGRSGAARCCASAAAAARTSTARRSQGELLDTRALSRHRRLRADRTGGHRALRHAAGRTRGGARRAAARCCAFEPPAFGDAAHGRRHGRRRPVRTAPRGGGRGARLRARRDAARRAGQSSALRRTGDEERRRLRRVAPAGRLARHARPDHSRCR